MLCIEQRAERLGRKGDVQHAGAADLDAGGLRPLGADGADLRGGVDRAEFLHLPRRHLHHVVDDALEPLDVLAHHHHQLTLGRVGRVLGEQGIGLGDRGERIPDLVGDAGRDAPHGGELLLAAARLHAADVLEEEDAELLARRRLALPREADAHAQGPARVGGELDRDVAAGLGPRRLGEGALDGANERAPSRDAAQLERRGSARSFRHEQASRRRIGGAHLSRAVDDQHAVLHLLDHEPVELGLLARHLEAASRAQFLARKPAGELAGEHGDDEEAAAREPRLRHQQRHLAAGDDADPRRGEQRQRRGRGGREREHPRREHAGHQHRQTPAGNVIEARRRRGDVEHREERQVGADRRQPLRAAQARERLRGGAAEARQQPHADRERRIGDAHRDHGAARPQAEGASQDERDDEGDADRCARRDEGAVDALERRLGDGAASRGGARGRRDRAAGLAEPLAPGRDSPRTRSAPRPRSASRRSATGVGGRAEGAEPRFVDDGRRRGRGRAGASASKDALIACAARRPTDAERSTVARRRPHGARFCAFSNAVRWASPQKTPPRPGSASSRGR